MLIVVGIPVFVILLTYLAGVVLSILNFGVAGQLAVLPLELGVLAATIALGVIGFARNSSVSLADDRITIERGDVRLTSRIVSVHRISNQDFHGHYSRYRNVTLLGPVRRDRDLILIRGTDQCLVLSVSSDIADELSVLIEQRSSESIAA